MANTKLKVAPRAVLGKKVAALRRSGITPANVYGAKVDSTPVQADTIELTHLLRKISRNAIVDLDVEGEPKPRTVVVRQVSRDPVTDRLLHIDFYEISMTETMRAEVRVVLSGTSPAVVDLQGVLLQMVETVAVEALPGDIPTEFNVDVARLTELEQSIHVRDLDIDESKVTLLTDPDVVVARVAAPRLAVAEEDAAIAGETEAPAAEEGETPAEAATEESGG